MRKWFVLSIAINIICIPLAAIYVVRKIQFYQELSAKPVAQQNGNPFWKVRNSEFKELKVDSNSIVFIGDSHTQFFELSEAFNNINVKNRGIGLDGTASVLDRIGYLIDEHPQKIFIQIGVNDLLSGVQPQIVAADISKMIEEIQATSPKTKIYIQSVFPTNWNKYKDHKSVFNDVIKLNALLEPICHKTNCTYIDLYSLLVKGNGLNSEYDSGDSLHLNGKGYVLWRDYVKRFVAN